MNDNYNTGHHELAHTGKFDSMQQDLADDKKKVFSLLTLGTDRFIVTVSQFLNGISRICGKGVSMLMWEKTYRLKPTVAN